MNPFFRVLPLPMFWILTCNVLNHFYTFPCVCLFMAVASYHIQLTNLILQ